MSLNHIASTSPNSNLIDIKCNELTANGRVTAPALTGAYMNFTVAGLNVNKGYNVTNVTRAGGSPTGVFNMNLTSPLANLQFVAQAMAEADTAVICTISSTVGSPTLVQIRCFDATGTLVDPAGLHVMIMENY